MSSPPGGLPAIGAVLTLTVFAIDFIGSMRILWQVLVPISLPAILRLVLLTFTWTSTWTSTSTWNEFLIPLVMSPNGNVREERNRSLARPVSLASRWGRSAWPHPCSPQAAAGAGAP
ncbi:MAG: hypothetical protein ACTIA6_11795 [Pseudoclavibacter sp.]